MSKPSPARYRTTNWSSYNASLRKRGQVTQKPPGIGCGLVVVDADKDPSGRAVDGYEEITTAIFISHLKQILHVDMDVAGLIRL